MKSSVVVFVFGILTFSLISSSEATCPNDCNHKGTCTNSKCTCYIGWDNEDCSSSWKEDTQGWIYFWITYRVYTCVIHGALLIWAIFEIVLNIRAHKGLKSNVVTHSLTMLIIAEFFRVLDFALDPDSIYGIIPIWLDDLMYNLPVLLWMDVAYLVLLYWTELVQFSGINQISSISKLRPVLITLAIVFAMTIVPTGLWETFIPNPISYTVYNVIIAIGLIICIILSFTYGAKLMRLVKMSWISSQSMVFKEFLERLTTFLLCLNIFISLIIIALVIFVTLNISAWKFVIFHAILRTLEMFAVGCTILMFRNKKPPKENSNTAKSISSELNVIELQ